ncbi:hypothetical protein [Bremerella cremea]|uniref:type IV pilus biogenesis protein PilM n=1 Tax=Bremerella cremea TaxID=1031537 RepID=UPI0031EAD9A0
MAKKLAIEWDSHSLRMVVGRQRGSSLVVEKALHFPLTKPGEEADKSTLESRLSRLVTEQANAHGLGKLPTLVGVSRSSVELQVFSVPPVPDDELPDIVRYQAMREFSSLGEDGVVDFIKLGADADGKLRVHAAAIASKQLKSIQKICEKAQLQPQSLSVRSFGSAYFAASQSRFADSTFLLVEVLDERIELTVVHRGDVLFSRSTRLPGEPGSEHQTTTLQGEIRRTMFAAQAKGVPTAISQIVILGEPLAPAIWKKFGEDLKVSVEFLAPMAAEHVSGSVDVSPEIASQMGALIGILLADAASLPKIDLLNPRRRPDPPDRKRLFTLGALAAAPVVLFFGYFLYSGISSRDAEIEELKADIARLQKENKPLVVEEEKVLEIDNWVASDVQWLDELYRMSKELPTADEMIATRIHMQPGNSAGGTTSLEGYVADQSVIGKIEAGLIGENHAVLGKGTQERSYGDAYSISFQEYVTITPDGTDRFAPRDYSEEMEEDAAAEEPTADEPANEETKPESPATDVVAEEAPAAEATAEVSTEEEVAPTEEATPEPSANETTEQPADVAGTTGDAS